MYEILKTMSSTIGHDYLSLALYKAQGDTEAISRKEKDIEKGIEQLNKYAVIANQRADREREERLKARDANI